MEQTEKIISKHIWINIKLKDKLKKLMTHPRDTYGDMVQKLYDFYKTNWKQEYTAEFPKEAKGLKEEYEEVKKITTDIAEKQ